MDEYNLNLIILILLGFIIYKLVNKKKEKYNNHTCPHGKVKFFSVCVKENFDNFIDSLICRTGKT